MPRVYQEGGENKKGGRIGAAFLVDGMTFTLSRWSLFF
jgi:hypothetical protein